MHENRWGSAAAFFSLLEEAGNSTSLSLPLQVEQLPDYQIAVGWAQGPVSSPITSISWNTIPGPVQWPDGLGGSSRLLGFLKLFPRPLRMWGVPRSTPILGLGRQVYLVFPHYKLQSQKEHSKSTSWNLPPSLEALIQHSKGGHPGPPKMGSSLPQIWGQWPQGRSLRLENSESWTKEGLHGLNHTKIVISQIWKSFYFHRS